VQELAQVEYRLAERLVIGLELRVVEDALMSASRCAPEFRISAT